MAKKPRPTPRKAQQQSTYYSEAHLAAIAQALGVPLTLALAQDLSIEAGVYRQDRKQATRRRAARAHYRETRRALRNACQALEDWTPEEFYDWIKLLRAFEAGVPAGHGESIACGDGRTPAEEQLELFPRTPPLRMAHAFEYERVHVMIEDFLDLGHRLSSYLAMAARASAPPPGRPEDWGLKAFIERLANLYERETGRAPGLSRNIDKNYSGPFSRFVMACLSPISPDRHGNALGDTIRQALKARRSRPPRP